MVTPVPWDGVFVCGMEEGVNYGRSGWRRAGRGDGRGGTGRGAAFPQFADGIARNRRGTVREFRQESAAVGAQAIAETVRFRRNCARFRRGGGSPENRTGAHRSGAERRGKHRSAPERRGAVRRASDGIGPLRRAPETPRRESRERAGRPRRRPDGSGRLRNAPDGSGTHRKGPERSGEPRSESAGSGQLSEERRLKSRGAKKGPRSAGIRPPRPALRGDGSPSNSPTRTRLRPTRHGAPATGG